MPKLSFAIIHFNKASGLCKTVESSINKVTTDFG